MQHELTEGAAINAGWHDAQLAETVIRVTYEGGYATGRRHRAAVRMANGSVVRFAAPELSQFCYLNIAPLDLEYLENCSDPIGLMERLGWERVQSAA